MCLFMHLVFQTSILMTQNMECKIPILLSRIQKSVIYIRDYLTHLELIKLNKIALKRLL